VSQAEVVSEQKGLRLALNEVQTYPQQVQQVLELVRVELEVDC
jgi:hypothetical protein